MISKKEISKIKKKTSCKLIARDWFGFRWVL